MTRSLCVGAIAATLFAMTAPGANAITEPVADPAALPANPGPSAAPSVMQLGGCTATTLLPGTPTSGRPNPDLEQAWRFSRGANQTVAIISTGVQPSDRIHVEPGGDYIQNTDGLTDCDGQGTMVAGIIGAQPGPDGFSGIAPEARLVSIRQTSSKFSSRPTEGDDPATRDTAHSLSTLARAIVHAADLGARVINVSTAICVPVVKNVDQAALGAAVRYAAVDKDAVVVAAAGNVGGSGPNCEPNPLSGAGADPRNWSGVEAISAPSWWQPYVLSVGSVNLDGAPSKFTMPGPWVGASAVGENVVSLSNRPEGGLANGVIDQKGKPVPIQGTGYAAAYVSGVAALVRSRYPELNASEVISRLQQTSRNAGRSPSNLVGVGTVDPVAALTWELNTRGGDVSAPTSREVVPPPVAAPENPLPRRLAFLGSGICLLAVIVVAAFSARRRQESPE